MQIRIFGVFAHLFLSLQYIVELLPVIFGGIRNKWYQSYNTTIIEIGAQKSQSGPIALPSGYINLHKKLPNISYLLDLVIQVFIKKRFRELIDAFIVSTSGKFK